MKKKAIITGVILIVILAIVVFTAIRITSADISAEQAQNIALEHAGVSKEKADFTKVKLFDRKYEIEFNTPDSSYEYKISAVDGEIKEYEQKSRQNENSAMIPQETVMAPVLSDEEQSSEQAVSDSGQAQTSIEQVQASSEQAQTNSVNTNTAGQTQTDTERILSAAYQYAGVNSQNVSYREIDFDDGLYEVEFYASGYKYECKVSPSGEVIEFEQKRK